MLNIFVLEDDFFQQSRLENAIRRCVEETSVRYKFLEVFGKSNQLLESIEEAGNHQFFFLDIEKKEKKRKEWKSLKKSVLAIRIKLCGQLFFAARSIFRNLKKR